MDFIIINNLSQETKGFIINLGIMIFGVIATFLSADTNIKNENKIVVIAISAFFFDVVTALFYGTGSLFIITIICSILLVIICSLIILRKETVSIKKIDKMIRKFTDNADDNHPLKILGGDLNFFGNVKDGSIHSNKQFNQIKKRGFTQIHILCLKPVTNSEKDSNTILRIGFLLKELHSGVKIKFFDENLCNTCSKKPSCALCNICDNCNKSNSCDKKTTSCNKLNLFIENNCYNPDLDIRGRIVTKSNSSSEMAAIYIKDKPAVSYILRVYNSDTKECSMYKKIWDIWWKKCKEDNEFIDKCIKVYEGYQENNRI